MGAILEAISDPIQWIGYAGMIFALLSYQFRQNRVFFLLQAACAVAFTVQFALLHSYAAMLMNVVAVFRGLIFARRDLFRHPLFHMLLQVLFAGCCLVAFLFFEEKWWIALLLSVALCGGTLVMWGRDGKKIRFAQFFMISPIWILNNLYYGSVGGVVCELFNMGSALVSFIRFRKTGYDKT